MKQALKDPITYIAAYVVVAVFTFGHAYNQYPNEEVGKFAGLTYTITNGPGTKGLGSIAASIGWPLYWSVKLQETK